MDAEDFNVEIPQRCPTCGGTDIYLRIRPKANMAAVACRSCGESRALKHIENQMYRTTRDAAWARLIKARFNGTCAICGSNNKVQAHHIIPYSADENNRYNINNGILLCEECHRKAHAGGKHG